MKRILIADDDPVVLSVYSEGLSKLGMQVDTVGDGLAAVKALQGAKPDLMVLDLDMPKLSGVDVLKFIRSNSPLRDLPVIVLSNSYAQDLAREAATVGAQKGLLKISCNPLLLAGVIGEIIDGQTAADTDSHLLGVAPAALPAKPEPPPPAMPAPTTPVNPVAAPQVYQAPTSAPSFAPATDPGLAAAARHDFLQKAKGICSGLRNLHERLMAAATERDRTARLQDLYRRIEFLTASAEVVGCLRIGRMSNALQALLMGMMDKPSRITQSALQTSSDAIDFVSQQLQNADGSAETPLPSLHVIVVDDDQISNRLVVSSLRAVQIRAQSEFDPLAALRLLSTKSYDLVLLDVEMPGMDGVNFCQHLRSFPGYQTTPVIFVTLHGDPETRARAIESGGNDLIAKPISPLELAVKVVMHWLKGQCAGLRG